MSCGQHCPKGEGSPEFDNLYGVSVLHPLLKDCMAANGRRYGLSYHR